MCRARSYMQPLETKADTFVCLQAICLLAKNTKPPNTSYSESSFLGGSKRINAHVQSHIAPLPRAVEQNEKQEAHEQM
jgi:hypothetical protein